MSVANGGVVAAPLPAQMQPDAPGREPFSMPPDAALRAVSAFGGLVLVDLDETLYLSNSTEDFIDLARPALPAAILLRLLDGLRPWRWTGGDATRDVWRVRLILLLFPWTAMRWRKHVERLAVQFANRPLLSQLQNRHPAPIVTTAGFLPIVQPLVAALGLPEVRVIGSRTNTFDDRRLGKLHGVREALGEPALRGAMLVTDSLQDLPLLQLCCTPVYTTWPGARYRRALSGVYLPGQYIALVKRPGEHYFFRAILQEDYALWVISSIALAAAPWPHAAGLLLLLVSFWTIYERGYVDNDLMGAKHETDPRLSAAFFEAPVATPFWQPWGWAAAFGAAGVWVLRGGMPTALDAVKWAGVLVATYAWFAFYNRTDKAARTWMFSVLQLARAAAFTVLVPIEPIGAMALGAHVLARWTPYYLYRLRGSDWPGGIAVGPIRTLFFAVLALLLVIASGWPALINWTAYALFAWCLYRSGDGIRQLFTSNLFRSARN